MGDDVNSNGIVAIDDDGSAQTQALAISFTGLPEGATYDAQTKRLNWTPGPGQIGDFIIAAQVSDGKNIVTRTFTVRSVADAAANAPKILVSTTPSTPALPGQNIVAAVRADAYSSIDSIVVEVRGAALNGDANSDQWQIVTLDGAGRLRLTPAQPGLIEVRVTATDRDGFSSTQTHTIRVKDPADTQAPALAWTGVLAGATALGRPVEFTELTELQAGLQERQLMGYKLEIALAGGTNGANGSSVWRTLAEQSAAAADSNQLIDITSLDPALFANGVYQVRFSAWDLVGRTTTIDARLIIDTQQKNLVTITATDASYPLDGHTLALTRTLDSASDVDFGNWRIAALDTRLTTDQPETTASGAIAPWTEGARVWLQIPDNLSTADAAQHYLSFTLSTKSERLGTEAAAPIVLHPLFSNSQGWTLEAHSNEDDSTDINAPEMLIRQGHHLYSQTTGLPWVPTSYSLIGPDGTRYALGADGKVAGVSFADGAQWIVSDAGIAAVTGDATTRVDFIRDTQGRISRVTGPGDTPNSDAKTMVYRYDNQDRLILARSLNSPDFGAPYGYDAAGKPFADTITANLGAAVNWLSNSQANQWSGTLPAGQTTTLAFSVRESELASTIKVPGAQGAVIIAVESQLADTQASLQFTGATVVGISNIGGKQTTLLRVTKAGLKLIRINGTGASAIRVSIVGDLNNDGVIDGIDSAAWEQDAASSNSAGDINGDGLVNQADRQILYANYGWKTNQTPIAGTLPSTRTHTDLATHIALTSIAQDFEGDQVFWRLLNTTHGSASFSGDGQSLLFTPEEGYVGFATILVQADDGFAASAPIALTVNVSGAKLLAIHLAPLPSLRPGAFAIIKATADFADEAGVDVSANGSYLTVSSADLSGMGLVGESAVQVDDSRDLIRATGSGPVLVIVTRIDTDGRTVRAVVAVNSNGDNSDGTAIDPLIVQPDVYPGILALAPGGTRQLKVHLLDPNTGLQTDIHTASQTVFAGTPESVYDYLDPSTQDPLLDPITGDVMLDPDTGEVLHDPNTGVTTQYAIPAVAPVYSGTRYLVSDESIATVSESGLITALHDGQVTISIIHLASVADGYGTISQQVVGQSNIALMVQAAQITDEDDSTPAPRSISISKDVGGVVSDTTGETVLIGAGALRDDTAVSINRLNLASIEAEVGMPLPAQGALEAIGAFHLDIGDTTTAYPLQLVIPLQGSITADAGEEVFFMRKGKILTPDGSFADTWWLVDNGRIGTDAQGNMVARTASPPYDGVGSSGEYIVSDCQKTPVFRKTARLNS